MQSVPSTLSPPSGGRTLRRVLILLFAGLLTIGMLQPTAAHPGYGGHAKLWVKDTSVVEPDTGTTYAKVKIVLKSKHYKAEHHAKGKRGKVKIYFKTVDGSATAGEDYTAVRGKGYLPLSKKRHVVAYIKVPVLGDTIDEPDEYFKVLVKARGAKVKDGVGVVTIVDNDEAAPPPPPEKPQLVVRDLKVDEGKVADFQIWLSAPAPEGLTFDYATVDAAAKAGQDYVAKTGNDVLIPKGATGFTVSVPTIQDTVDEPDEDFLLRVSDVKNATVLKAQGRAVILDDDVAKPSLTIKDVQVEEGKRAVLEVHLSAASTETVAVDFKTYDGSATQGEDYTATTGTLYFTAGVTVRRIAVDTLEDLKVEGTEKFGVLLTNPRNATIADGQGKVEILDDDS